MPFADGVHGLGGILGKVIIFHGVIKDRIQLNIYLPQRAGGIRAAVICLLLQQVILPLPDIQFAYLIDWAPAESRTDMRIDDFFPFPCMYWLFD